MSEALKDELLKLLDRDAEFRHAVAGYLGLSETLRNLEKLWGEVRSLREGQTKVLEELKRLREGQYTLWEEMRKMYGSLRSSLNELRKVLPLSFEEYSATFLELTLVEMGYQEARVDKKHLVHDGEIVKIDMFCENPLVVGEVTTSISSPEEAEREVAKLVKKIEIAEKRYSKRVMLAVLSVARTTPEAYEALKAIATKHGVRIVLGREIKEHLDLI